MPAILFIRGTWPSADGWDRWRDRYERAGRPCLLPDRPFADLPDNRRRTTFRFEDILAHYTAIIEALPEPPVLVGHSLGGILVQLLLDSGLGAAGVALAAPSPRRTLRALAVLRTALPLWTAWRAWRHLPPARARCFGSTTRAPLLLIAAEKDRVVPPGSVQADHERQLAAGSETAFRLFPRRSHHLTSEPDWEDIADYCLAWAETRTVEP